MTLDIANHCTCPIHPEHKQWFILQGPEGFYTDGCCPFGCSSSSSNAGMIGNASVDIWQKEGVTPIVKFEDDLNIFCLPITGGPNPDGTLTPYTYAYDCPQALSRIASLCIPWHPDKGQDFAFSFTYLGFFWNIQNKTVPLHDHKHKKFLNHVNNFLASFTGGCCQMQDVMKIHGSRFFGIIVLIACTAHTSIPGPSLPLVLSTNPKNSFFGLSILGGSPSFVPLVFGWSFGGCRTVIEP